MNDGHKWQPGESGNPAGRPKKEREREYMNITLNTVSTEEWRKVIAKAAEQAMAGDKDARKWLGDYLIGTPTQFLEIVGMVANVDELIKDKDIDDLRRFVDGLTD